MPLREERFNFTEEIERLEDERETLLDRYADADPGSQEAAVINNRGQKIDDHLAGVRWARDEAYSDPDVNVWDEDVDGITLGGLTGGEYGRVEDDIRSAAHKHDRTHTGGTARVFMVARGTTDAPYVNGYDETEVLAATQQLPQQYLKWAEHHVDRLTTVGVDDEGNLSFSAAAAKRRAEQNDTTDKN